jgi:hypothetical protein
VTCGIRFAELLDETGGHLGVAMDFGSFETLKLEVATVFEPCCDCCRRFTVCPICQVAVFYGRNFDMEINSVEQRPGYAGAVTVDHDWCAGA